MLRTCASFRRDLSHARFTPQAAFKNPSQIFEFIGRGSLEPRPDSIERLLEREAHPPLGRHLADRLIHDSNRQSKGMSLEWDKQHPTPVFLNRRGCLEPLPLQPLAQPDRKIFAEASLVHEMRPRRSCFEQVSPQGKTSIDNGVLPFSSLRIPRGLANIREATELYAEDLIDAGDPIPDNPQDGTIVIPAPAVVVSR